MRALKCSAQGSPMGLHCHAGINLAPALADCAHSTVRASWLLLYFSGSLLVGCDLSEATPRPGPLVRTPGHSWATSRGSSSVSSPLGYLLSRPPDCCERGGVHTMRSASAADEWAAIETHYRTISNRYGPHLHLLRLQWRRAGAGWVHEFVGLAKPCLDPLALRLINHSCMRTKFFLSLMLFEDLRLETQRCGVTTRTITNRCLGLPCNDRRHQATLTSQRPEPYSSSLLMLPVLPRCTDNRTVCRHGHHQRKR
jgi:hypothetical protein